MILYPHLVQRTPAWHQARLGRLCGSRAADMLATIKSGEAAARRDLRLELACERLTGHAAESAAVTAVMQRGIDLEATAVAAYEAATGRCVEAVGFCAHDTLQAGCSPDGLIRGDTGIVGLVEIKCPKAATHVRYLQSDSCPVEHRAQVTHNLWITGACWCDVVSFDDRFPAPLAYWSVRVQAADLDLAAYEARARAFLAEVDRAVEALRRWQDGRAGRQPGGR